MRQSLDRFILGLPILFLKQYPYAWIPAVVFWPRSPSIAALFLAVVAVGILSLRWHAAAWIRWMRSEHAPDGGKFYVDRPAIPWGMAVRKIGLLVAGSAAIAYLLQGQLGLSFWQFFFILVGFVLFYQDNRIFGAEAAFIVTASGIGIRFVPGHLEYRLFLAFREISRIERKRYQESRDIALFASTRQEQQDGLLLIPKDPGGFSKRLDKVFLVPADLEQFVAQLPYGFGRSA